MSRRALVEQTQEDEADDAIRNWRDEANRDLEESMEEIDFEDEWYDYDDWLYPDEDRLEIGD